MEIYTVLDAPSIAVISRAEAKALGLTRYFTGKSCVHGHVVERHVANKACSVCLSASSKASTAKHIDKRREAARAAYWKNPEHHKEVRRARGKRDRAKENERNRDFLAANPDKAKEYQARNFVKRGEINRVQAIEWRKKNPEKQAFYRNRRRAMEYAAIPVLSDDLTPIMQAEVLAIYAECRTTQELTGVRHDVDHIFPIMKGGVHAPWNLRVLTRSANQSKKDKWPADEPVLVMWHGLLVSRVNQKSE